MPTFGEFIERGNTERFSKKYANVRKKQMYNDFFLKKIENLKFKETFAKSCQ